MNDPMTPDEYAAATVERRRLSEKILKAELEELRQALAERRTIKGKLEVKSRANMKAARMLALARQAALIAEHARLTRESLETEELGRQRLEAATAEIDAHFGRWAYQRANKRKKAS